jgi:uncharacterized protein
MKKRFVLFLLAALLISCLSISASAEGSNATIANVVDTAGILTESQVQALQEKAAAISSTYGCAVYIVVVDDFTKYTNSRDIYDLAVQMYDQYVLGWDNGNGADHRDSLILLMSMDDRDYALDTNGYLGNKAFNNPGMYKLEEAMIPYFRSNDWYGGFDAFLNCAESLLQSPLAEEAYVPSSGNVVEHGYEPPGSASGGKSPFAILIVVFVPLLIAFIVCSAFKSQMKTANRQTTAGNYVVPGSVRMRIRQDDFVNRTVQRTVIQSDSGRTGSSGGGGHFSGGHSGHSGKF